MVTLVVTREYGRCGPIKSLVIEEKRSRKDFEGECGHRIRASAPHFRVKRGDNDLGAWCKSCYSPNRLREPNADAGRKTTIHGGIERVAEVFSRAIDALPAFSGVWTKTGFFLEDGMIKENPSARSTTYDPFDHRTLYLEFAAIDEGSEKRIHDFVNRYGILGLEFRNNLDLAGFLARRLLRIQARFLSQLEGEGYDKALDYLMDKIVGPIPPKVGLTRTISPDDEKRVHSWWVSVASEEPIVEGVDAFVREARKLRLLIELKASLEQSKDIDALLRATEKLQEWGVSTAENSALINVDHVRRLSKDRHGTKWTEELTLELKFVLHKLTFDELQRAHPVLMPVDKWHLHFVARDLLSSMYVMFAQDIASGLTHRICKNETCRNQFIPENPRRLYCSDRCREAQKQRELRRRRK